MDDENRQEYYLDLMKRIVDEEREALGEEAALKWARKTPLKINSKGEITGFYGKGEETVEILRSYTEHQEFYLECLQKILNKMTSIFGRKIGQKYARQAPLEITPDGEIQAYYGTGRNALQNLINQYELYMGEETANKKIRSALSDVPDEKVELLPEEIQTQKEEESSEDKTGLMAKIVSKMKNL